MAAARKPWLRLLVTLIVPVAAWGAGFVTLPGVNGGALEHLARGGRGLAYRFGGLEQLSVVALGLIPVITGFTLVELLALAVPRWRPLRTGGPSERASLRLWSLLLSVGLAAIQGWFIARWLESFSWRYMMFGEIVKAPGLSWELLVAVTLVGGTCFLVALAWLIDRYGLGNGIAVLLASAAVPMALELAARLYTGVESAELDLADVFGLLARLGAIAAATWWILTVHRRMPGALRHPTSGAIPIVTAASILMLPITIGNLGLRLRPLEVAPGTRSYEAALLVLVGLLCVGLSWLFYRHARGTPALWPSIGRTAAYLGAVVLLARPTHAGAPIAIDAVMVIVAVAVILDLAAEWRARLSWGELTSVWPLHQVARLDETLARLAAAGVPAHPRGASYRALVHFFGPFVPIELMVPVERAAEARALLDPPEEPDA